MHYLYLVIAIISEVIATTALKSVDKSLRLGPIAVTVVGYLLAFAFLRLSLKHFSLGVAYGIWSGVGMVLIAVLAYFIHNQKLDLPAIVGISLIVAGVLVLNLVSNTKIHEALDQPGAATDFCPNSPETGA
jgi:small multidrug resistance pump